MADPTRRPRRLATVLARALLAAALAIALVAVPASSTAHWTATASVAKPSVSGAVVATPSGFSCVTTRPPLSLTRFARLSWQHPDDNATFEVWVSSGANGADRTLLTTTSAKTLDLNSNLLSGLVSTLLSLLLGGQPLYADVVAVHDSGWRSQVTSTRQPVSNDGLIGGLLGGVRCGT